MQKYIISKMFYRKEFSVFLAEEKIPYSLETKFDEPNNFIVVLTDEDNQKYGESINKFLCQPSYYFKRRKKNEA